MLGVDFKHEKEFFSQWSFRLIGSHSLILLRPQYKTMVDHDPIAMPYLKKLHNPNAQESSYRDCQVFEDTSTCSSLSFPLLNPITKRIASSIPD